MIRVKSTSEEGVYYLVNGWYKQKMIWAKPTELLKYNTIFKDVRTAKMVLTKLLKVMPEYAYDTFEFIEIKERG